MNKRQAKKRLRYAIKKGNDSLRTGIGVSTTCQVCIDENGKICNWNQPGSRMICLKRPKIRYFKRNVDSKEKLHSKEVK